MAMSEKEAWLRERACTRKRGYTSKREAKRAVKSTMRGGSGELQAYRCSFCGKWHAGHK